MASVTGENKDPEVEGVIKDMYDRLSKEFGITLIGNRVTIRWYLGKELVDAHMIIESVGTPSEMAEASAKHERYRKLIDKYKKKFPDLEAELYKAETGEWPK